jgi:hypothetical protein
MKDRSSNHAFMDEEGAIAHTVHEAGKEMWDTSRMGRGDKPKREKKKPKKK